MRNNVEKITQSEFIEEVAKNSHFDGRLVKAVLHEAAKAIVGYTKHNYAVPFMGLGKFFPHDAPERMGRNPKTGEEFKIPAKRVLKFKVSPTVDLNK